MFLHGMWANGNDDLEYWMLTLFILWHLWRFHCGRFLLPHPLSKKFRTKFINQVVDRSFWFWGQKTIRLQPFRLPFNPTTCSIIYMATPTYNTAGGCQSISLRTTAPYWIAPGRIVVISIPVSMRCFQQGFDQRQGFSYMDADLPSYESFARANLSDMSSVRSRDSYQSERYSQV